MAFIMLLHVAYAPAHTPALWDLPTLLLPDTILCGISALCEGEDVDGGDWRECGISRTPDLPHLTTTDGTRRGVVHAPPSHERVCSAHC